MYEYHDSLLNSRIRWVHHHIVSTTGIQLINSNNNNISHLNTYIVFCFVYFQQHQLFKFQYARYARYLPIFSQMYVPAAVTVPTARIVVNVRSSTRCCRGCIRHRRSSICNALTSPGVLELRGRKIIVIIRHPNSPYTT